MAGDHLALRQSTLPETFYLTAQLSGKVPGSVLAHLDYWAKCFYLGPTSFTSHVFSWATLLRQHVGDESIVEAGPEAGYQ